MKKLIIEEMQSLAASRGGECLSMEYVNSSTKLLFRCAEGHEWNAVSGVLRKGHWCSVCAAKTRHQPSKLTITEMCAIADGHGGVCLSTDYVNSQIKLSWRCAKGHEWKARAGNIKKGHWCKRCSSAAYAQTLKLTIQDMRTIATSRGGKCLSSEYIKSNTRLLWQCASNHEWYATPASIKGGSWCPTCSKVGSSVGERISREILELMFGVHFKKRRPEWLRGLELDGYAESLSAAFEYQGQQHYMPWTRWHVNDFARQQERDSSKRAACFARGVRLIEIHYFSNFDDLPGCIDAIEQSVTKAGLVVPVEWPRPVDLPQIRAPLTRVFGAARLARLSMVADRNGGKMLSCEATTATTPLLWQCKAGHEWFASVHRIENGTWCLNCSHTKPKTTSEMHALASSRGGKFLSSEYLGANKPHDWSCDSCGNKWTTTAAKIWHGQWCSVCAIQKTRKSIDDVRSLAKKNGGEFLSEEYKNSRIKYNWRCSDGHEWMAPVDSISRGKWCRACHLNQRSVMAKRKPGRITDTRQRSLMD